MSAKEIQQLMEERFEKDINALGYDLRYVEWSKEGSEWYLRFFISRPEGISIDDCETVSRYLDPLLDEEFGDFKDGYILEVSSPGIEAPIRRERDYEEAMHELVHVKLYQKIDGKKEFEGILESYDTKSIQLDINGTLVTIDRDKISSARLAVQL